MRHLAGLARNTSIPSFFHFIVNSVSDFVVHRVKKFIMSFLIKTTTVEHEVTLESLDDECRSDRLS